MGKSGHFQHTALLRSLSQKEQRNKKNIVSNEDYCFYHRA